MAVCKLLPVFGVGTVLGPGTRVGQSSFPVAHWCERCICRCTADDQCPPKGALCNDSELDVRYRIPRPPPLFVAWVLGLGSCSPAATYPAAQQHGKRKESGKQGTVRDDYYGAQRHCQGRPATEPANCQRSLSLIPEPLTTRNGDREGANARRGGTAGRSAWNQLPHWLLPTVQRPFSGPVPWFRCPRVTCRTFSFFL
ncbi:hypothetical protein EDB80DRAFT_697924 [Ilyonectria destructans]|nr:hypothetical protein EDB80DRAFT_697924 [Ilyonectria destructans]